MKSYSLLFLLIIIFSSCKKSSDGFTRPPGNPNHEVKAMVSVKGGAFSTFTATGNSTSFSRNNSPTGDNIISVTANIPQSSLQLTLVNITTGVYPIGGVGLLIPPYVTGAFTLGSYSMNNSSFEIFTATPVPGTITIEELTSSSIRGSYSMTCTGITGTVQISNGTFKGTF
jgi:hypothetical protein